MIRDKMKRFAEKINADASKNKWTINNFMFRFVTVVTSRSTTANCCRVSRAQAVAALNIEPDTWFDFKNHVENGNIMWNNWGDKFEFNNAGLNSVIIFFDIDTISTGDQTASKTSSLETEYVI